MGTPSERIISPVGRFIGGSITEMRTTDYEGRIKPEDKHQYEFALAIRKDDPEINNVLGAVYTHAMTEFAAHPAITAIIGQFDFNAQGFSWKIGDGDKPDKKGNYNKNSTGCWVIYFKSARAISCVDTSHNPIPAESVKRGFFAVVSFNVVGNGLVNNNSGVYINPELLMLVYHGEEITGTADAAVVFKDHVIPATLPPGASMTPVAPQGMPAPQQQPVAGAVPQPGVPQQPVAGAVPQPGQPAGLPQPTGAPTSQTASALPHPNFAQGPQG